MRVIGVAGYAKSGKDTFVGIARKILERNGYNAFRVAFADDLKTEVGYMLQHNKFKVNVLDMTPEEKERIRPLFVFWGCQRRYETESGLYWVNIVDKLVRKMDTGSDKDIALVSDVRFANEAAWIHKSWDGVVIHLKRWVTERLVGTQDGSDEVACKVYDSAPNEEEAKNDPLVQDLADYKIEWESAKKMTTEEAIEDPKLQEVVLEVLNRTKYFKLPKDIIGTLS